MTNSQKTPATGTRGNELPASMALAIKPGTQGSPAPAHTAQAATAGATPAGSDIQCQRAKAKGTIRRRARFLLVVTAAVLGALLVTGCGGTNSGNSGAQWLIHLFPWLASLGLPFIQGLLAQFGSNLGALLAAAAAALGM
jgi:hypothetical protein